jgi:large conductance mechanosensitive channel
MKSFLKEFKAFAMRGNVVDLAIAVVIGAAFGKIVTSFTNDIIMPVIGLLTGGVDFSDLLWTLKEAGGDAAAVTLNYGAFINTVVSFVIIALTIFVVVKAMNKLIKKEEKKEEKKEPKPSKEESLLMEIRDLLKK